MSTPSDTPVAFDTQQYIELITNEFDNRADNDPNNRLPIRLIGHPTPEQLAVISQQLDGYVHNGLRFLARNGGRVFFIERV